MKLALDSFLVLLTTLQVVAAGGCSGGGCSKKMSGRGKGNGKGGYYSGSSGFDYSTGCTGKKCGGKKGGGSKGGGSKGGAGKIQLPLCRDVPYSPRYISDNTCRDTPLVFDMNHDRAIEVVKGQGVRMNRNNPGEHNGAAAKGDKMLAMCDMNKSGDIDGGEVFGDATRNPFFAGNPWIKAANGFQALHEVAKAAAERFPELSIIKLEEEDTMLNLPNLKQALLRIDCDLGFIGDDNVSHLESLRDVTWVKVSGYQSTPNDIQDGVLFGQKSWFSDATGRRWAVDDVWFPSHLRQ